MGAATDIKVLAATIVFLAAFHPLASAQSLPKAETILDRYVEVTGGKARYEKLKTQVSSGMVELSNPGITHPVRRASIGHHFRKPKTETILAAYPIALLDLNADGIPDLVVGDSTAARNSRTGRAGRIVCRGVST